MCHPAPADDPDNHRGRLLGQDAETITAWIAAGSDDEAALEATLSFADFTVDTDGLGQRQVVDKILSVTAWPARIAS
jgi:hypothetical protein